MRVQCRAAGQTARYRAKRRRQAADQCLFLFAQCAGVGCGFFAVEGLCEGFDRRLAACAADGAGCKAAAVYGSRYAAVEGMADQLQPFIRVAAVLAEGS
ncbi:hypothetical protein [Neisseria musculi]|uniref:hypothetical protein n=1 Tax=Neisseria musculi TaxID=1815583 RepID=UPI00164B1B6D|nr:hypothetical protein [Neisseria musculi]